MTKKYTEGRLEAVRIISHDEGVKSCAAGPWQPMETAPKDGTPILAWHKDTDLDRKKYIEYVVIRWNGKAWMDRMACDMNNAKGWASIHPPEAHHERQESEVAKVPVLREQRHTSF